MATETQDPAELAAAAIIDYEAAAEEHAQYVVREMELEAQRPLVKLDSILRIMQGGDNILTSRPHSASSAEQQVETDHGYRAHLNLQRDVVLAKMRAAARRTAAELRAHTAIALLQGDRDIRIGG